MQMRTEPLGSHTGETGNASNPKDTNIKFSKVVTRSKVGKC